MQLALVTSLLSGVASYKTYIKLVDQCDDNCKFVNRVFDVPEYVESLMPHTNFTLTADMTEPMSLEWRYDVWATIGPAREPMAWNGTGVPCGYTQVGDNVAFKLDLHLPECDAPAGPVHIPGSFRVSFPAPPVGDIHFHVEITDPQGAKVLGVVVHLSHDADDELAMPPVHPTVNSSQSLITARDCCDEACTVKNIQMEFPKTVHGPVFNFKVAGSLPQDLVGFRYGFHAMLDVFGQVPLNVLIGNGSACGLTTTGDHLEFNLGLDFPHCPMAAGDYVVPGYARFTAPLDAVGKITLRVEVTEEKTNAPAACVEVDLQFRPGQFNSEPNQFLI